MTEDSSPTLARDAALLARTWVNLGVSNAQAHAEAAAILKGSEPAEQPLLRDLSIAFESLHWFLNRLAEPACQAAIAKLLQQVRERGWPRAVRLAEAAWAWSRIYALDGHGPALSVLIEQQRRAEADPTLEAGLPVLERFWRHSALSSLYCVTGDHDQALAHGLKAEAMAAESSHRLLHSIAAQALAFVYLSVGDVEGACALLPSAIAEQASRKQSVVGLSFNYLLALVVSRRFADAAQLLREQPVLVDRGRFAIRPALGALVARVRLAEGRVDSAADLPVLRPEPFDGEAHTLAANRIWVCADVLNGLGRASEALELLEQGLIAFDRLGIRLLPMNATQWHRALADACEAQGDLPRAMAALRESQAHSFNWLAASMRARLQALHFAAGASPTDEQQRRQQLRLLLVDQALVAAREGSGSVDAAQRPRQLLAHLSREMRDPIHSVVWMTSMLMMSDLDDRQRKVVDLANSSARMALNLCNDVLDLAKLEASRFTLHLEPTDLVALVAECAQVFLAPAQGKGVGLHWHCDPAMPALVAADRLRLKQVLMNLLGNATKFTQAGRIDVGLLWLGDDTALGEPTVRLSVSDTGPGLSAQLMPRLFQEFEQEDLRTLRAHEGAGLGLALCRQFVRLMGGEIGVNNRPGEGCTFWCLLPLRAT